MAHFAALWIFFLAFADAVILLWCQSHDLENNTSIMAQRNEDTYLPLLDEAYTMLERVSPRNAGGAGSWIEVVAISRAFAKGENERKFVVHPAPSSSHPDPPRQIEHNMHPYFFLQTEKRDKNKLSWPNIRRRVTKLRCT